MNRSKILISILLLAALLCLSIIQASADDPSLTLDVQEAVVLKGKKLQLTASVTDTEGKVKFTWESSEPKVADVKNGSVTGKAAGEAVITCRTTLADGTELKASCKVAVQIPVSGIKAAAGNMTALCGVTAEPAAITILPADASNPAVTWESSDDSVAAVDEHGAVTGIKPGKAVVTATAADGSGKSCKINVTVYQAVESVTLDRTELVLAKKRAASLQATAEPGNSSGVKITWTSSDPKIAKVSNGRVTAASAGEADITVTAKSADGTEVSRVCYVIVYVPADTITADEKELKLFTGDTSTAGVKVTPADYTGTLQWSSADNTVAEVDAQGQVTACAPGKTVLTATVTDKYSDSSAQVFVTVTVRDGIPVQKIPFAAGNKFAIGIREDGTVLVSGDNTDKILNAQKWDHIVSVSAGLYHAAGLKEDGTVVAAGTNGDKQCNVSAWKEISQVSAGSQHTVALGRDGTVYAVGSNKEGQLEVNGWTDIVQVAAGSWHTVGLKADGTVVAAGYNEYGQCNVSGWRDIVAVDAGHWTTVGLKADGSVVFAGGWDADERKGMKEAAEWRGIRSIQFCDSGPIIGITMDGQCITTSGWFDPISDPEHEVVLADFDGYTNTLYCLLDNGTIIVKRANKYADTTGWKIRVPEVRKGDTLTKAELTMDYLLNGNYRQPDVTVRGKKYKAAGVLNDNAVAWYTGQPNQAGFEMYVYNPDKGALNYAFFDEAGDYFNYIFMDEMYLVLESKNDEFAKSYAPADSPVGWVEIVLENGVLTLKETDPSDEERGIAGRSDRCRNFPGRRACPFHLDRR